MFIKLKAVLFLIVLLFSMEAYAGNNLIVTWEPPADSDTLSKITYLIILNNNKGDLIHDSMERQLREEFSKNRFISIKASKNITSLQKQLNDFNYLPKTINEDSLKVARLNIKIIQHEEVKRLKQKAGVVLNSCNFLKTVTPCRASGASSLNSGTQQIIFKQTVTFSLTDKKGNTIGKDRVITKTYKLNSSIIPDRLLYVQKINEAIAREYAELFLPHEKSLAIKFIKGGDNLSLRLMKSGAYKSAIKRLEMINSSGKKTANLYHTGLSFEAIAEFVPAYNFYKEALSLSPTNKTIIQSIERIRWMVE